MWATEVAATVNIIRRSKREFAKLIGRFTRCVEEDPKEGALVYSSEPRAEVGDEAVANSRGLHVLLFI